MNLSNELLETLKMVLNDRRDEAHTRLYDAYAKCVSYQHFESHTRYIQQCVRELDSIQKQLDEITLHQRQRNTINVDCEDISEHYNKLHESDE